MLCILLALLLFLSHISLICSHFSRRFWFFFSPFSLHFCFCFSYFIKAFISHSQRISPVSLSQKYDANTRCLVTLRLFIQFLAYFHKMLVTENETVSFIYHSMYRVDVDVAIAVIFYFANGRSTRCVSVSERIVNLM